jgi:hypothetical protein
MNFVVCYCYPLDADASWLDLVKGEDIRVNSSGKPNGEDGTLTNISNLNECWTCSWLLVGKHKKKIEEKHEEIKTSSSSSFTK